MIPFRGGRQLANGHRNGLGSGFGGVVRYLLEGRREDLERLAVTEMPGAVDRPAAPSQEATTTADRVAWTSTRNLPTDDPHYAIRYLREWADQNPRVKKPVYHFGAAIHPDESLTRSQWETVADRMLERLGLDDHQAVVALHRDRDHHHIHVVVNRVGLDGRAWKPRFDALAMQGEARKIEKDFGLRVVPTVRDRRLEIRRAAGIDHRKAEAPFARRVAQLALDDFREAKGWEDLERRLEAHGLRLEPAKRGGGVNITDGFETVGLARADRSLSGPRLTARFGETLRLYRSRSGELHPPVVQTTPAPEIRSLEERTRELLKELSRNRATFTRAEIQRLANRDSQAQDLMSCVLGSVDLVDLGADRYTTREYATAEAHMFRTAQELSHRSSHRMDHDPSAQALEELDLELSDEQRQAVLEVATGQDLSQIVGRAGAGKTRLTRALVEIYEAEGYRVQGAALAGKAAEVLAEESGITCRTLASLEGAWVQGRDELTPSDLLLVDEAGMIEVRQMARLLSHVRQTGAKVVLLGDPDQLKAIGAGDAYRGLLEAHQGARLGTIYRQRHAWQRQAAEDLASGQVELALDAYQEHGRIEFLETPQAARDALVMAYFEERYLHPQDSTLLLAHRRADVRTLNHSIREARRHAGELGEGLRLNGREFAAGDRILFTRNDSTGRSVRALEGDSTGVRNGSLGTLQSLDRERFRVRLDDGRLVEFDPRTYYSIEHGYALTIHKSQGTTAERTFVLASRGLDRNLTYVALTRQRESVVLYADRETFRDEADLKKALARAPRKDLVRDHGPLGFPTADVAPLEPPPEISTFLEQTLSAEIEPVLRALARLETWDRLSAEAASITARRAELPYGGSLPDLERHLQSLPDPERVLPEKLSEIYRDPGKAQEALSAALKAEGPEAAYRTLAEDPAAWGQLRGRVVFGRPTATREAALAAAQEHGRWAIETLEQHSAGRQSLEDSEGYRQRLVSIDQGLRELGKDRDQLVARVGTLSEGISLEDLGEHLQPDQVELLRSLRGEEALYLAPLRDEIAAHRARRPAGEPPGSGRKLYRLATSAPRHILLRLTPPQLRWVVRGIRLLHSSLRTLGRSL